VGLPAVQAGPNSTNISAGPQTTFFSGLTAYLQARKFGSGDTDALWQTLENATRINSLANKMTTWTHQQGVPLVEASLSGTTLNLRQRHLRNEGEEPLDCSGHGTFSAPLPLPGPGDANTLGGARAVFNCLTLSMGLAAGLCVVFGGCQIKSRRKLKRVSVLAGIRSLLYGSLAENRTTWVRSWCQKYSEIAEQSWAFPPQMIAPNGSILSKATVGKNCLLYHLEMQWSSCLARDSSRPYTR
jgi:hypothetical protein